MKQRDVWHEALPLLNEAKLAAEQLVKVWSILAKSQPQHLRCSVSEPKLTERLHHHLCSLRASFGLLGYWTNEAQHALYDAEGNLIGRTRTDITYFSNASAKRLHLIFEFKKLARTSIKTYQGVNGMRRFVDGNYGNDEPLAAMVGVLKPDDRELIQSLCVSLTDPLVLSPLNMVHDVQQRYVRQPSAVFPDLQEAEFDTEHRRPTGGNTITLVHIFIKFP